MGHAGQDYGVMGALAEALQAYETACQAVAERCFGAVRLRRGTGPHQQPSADGQPIELVQKAGRSILRHEGAGTGPHAYQEQNFARPVSISLYPLLPPESPYASRTFWLRRRKRNVWPRPA